MKMTLTTTQVADRISSGGDFSYRASLALAEYYEEYEDCIGEQMELDPVAIRCDWGEYDSLQDWAEDYGLDLADLIDDADNATDEEKDEAIRDYITDRGTFIEIPSGGVLVESC